MKNPEVFHEYKVSSFCTVHMISLFGDVKLGNAECWVCVCVLHLSPVEEKNVKLMIL